MRHRTIVVCGAILLAGFISISSAANDTAVDKDKKAETEKDNSIKLPDQSSSEYWVIRSEAITELTPFITKKRAMLKERIQYFKDFMLANGLDYAKDFFAADIQVPADPKLRAGILGLLDKLEAKGIDLPPKPLTWDELVNVAMQFVQEEGYQPVQIEAGPELEQFKAILDRKEKLAIKIREELEVQLKLAIKAWLYLGQIKKQDEFRAFVVQTKEKNKQEMDAKRQQLLSDKTTADRTRREQEKQNIWQNRQDRLQNRYGYGYYYY
jgi:hypothetical protein